MVFPEVQHVCAMDTFGNTEWIRSIGAQSLLSNESSMTTDQFGNVYLLMTFYTDLHLPDTLLTTDNGNCMVTKFDSEGNRVWTEQFEGSAIPRSVWCNGKLSFAIAYYDEIEFSGSTYISDGESDFLLVWISSDGEVDQVKEIKGAGQSTVYDLSCIGQNTLVQGKFDQLLDFSGNVIGTLGETLFRSYQLFLDVDGDLVWNVVSSLHDVGTNVIQERAIQIDDRIVTVGQFGPSQVSFGGEMILNSGGVDGFMFNQNISDGSSNWLKQFGSDGNDYLMSIHRMDDNCLVSGKYSSSLINFEGGQVLNEYETVSQPLLFIVDTSGKFVCKKTIDDSPNQGGIAEITLHNSLIYAGIDFESDRLLDEVTTVISGQRNLAVWRTCLECDTLIGIEEQPNEALIEFYPNPTTGEVSIDLPNGVSATSLGVYDMLGKQVMELAYRPTVNVSGLPKGNYIIAVPTEERTYRQLLVVE